MKRRNRLKEILDALGFKVHEKKQPINIKVLEALDMTSHRIKDILENRVDKKDLTIREIDSICLWLGINQQDLLLSRTEDEKDYKDIIHVTMKANLGGVYTTVSN